MRFLLYLSFFACLNSVSPAVMSLISWLSKRNPKLVDKFEQPKLPGLPDPNNAATPTRAAEIPLLRRH